MTLNYRDLYFLAFCAFSKAQRAETAFLADVFYRQGLFLRNLAETSNTEEVWDYDEN